MISVLFALNNLLNKTYFTTKSNSNSDLMSVLFRGITTIINICVIEG